MSFHNHFALLFHYKARFLTQFSIQYSYTYIYIYIKDYDSCFFKPIGVPFSPPIIPERYSSTFLFFFFRWLLISVSRGIRSRFSRVSTHAFPFIYLLRFVVSAFHSYECLSRRCEKMKSASETYSFFFFIFIAGSSRSFWLNQPIPD